MKKTTIKMRPAWTGEIVRKMHLYNITQTDLAFEMGFRNKSYISMILNGKRTPPNCKERMIAALDKLILTKKR